MPAPRELALAHWRRSTAELYAAVRRDSGSNPKEAWEMWVAEREEMIRSHPASPLDATERELFRRLAFYPYDPAWRMQAVARALVSRAPEGGSALPEGELRYRAVATLEITAPRTGVTGALNLYWLAGYGGGLFLPFRDLTNGGDSYGGGRYLYDTIKGADLGAGSEEIVVDFNFAYNPSCAYSPRWSCPLAPRENALPFRVEAGERHPPVTIPPFAR